MEYEKTAADPNFFDTYHKAKNNLENLMKDWERLSEQLENDTF